MVEATAINLHLVSLEQHSSISHVVADSIVSLAYGFRTRSFSLPAFPKRLPDRCLLQELLVSVVSVDSLVHFTSADAERVPAHASVASGTFDSLSTATHHPIHCVLVEAENFRICRSESSKTRSTKPRAVFERCCNTGVT